MGWNSTVVFMNDCIHALKEDPEIGEKIEQGILALSVRKGSIDVPFKGYSGYIRVIETHHADTMVPILVGSNDGSVIEGASFIWSDPDPEMQLLRKLAEKKGYTLRRKPGR
jgi:hypothetical protein